MGLDVTRSLQPSCFLSGTRKSGRTEILKRVYTRLFWEQEAVVPFFYSLPKSLSCARTFCREYFFRACLELVGFLRKDPSLVLTEELNLDRIIQLAYESKSPWLIETVDHFHSSENRQDLQALAKLAIHFPAIVAMKTGFRAFVILDDFHHIASLPLSEELSLLSDSFVQAFESREAPHLFSGSSRVLLRYLFKTAELPGKVEMISLSPLNSEETQVLFERLCEHFDVAFEKELSLYFVHQLSYQPFYIRSLVRAARRERQDFRTVRHFADVYSHQLIEGDLRVYFDGLLYSAPLNPLERIKALEVLRLCARTSLDFSASHLFYRSHQAPDGFDIEKILNALDELGFIDYTFGVVSSIRDSVFKDWVECNFSHKIQGVSLQQVSYNIASDLLKRFNRSVYENRSVERLHRMRQILSQMNCQRVPTLLLDHEAFVVYQAIEDPQRKANHLSQEAELDLPEIVAVMTHGFSTEGETGFEPIVIGRGFLGGKYSDEAEVAWIAGYCPKLGTVGLEEVQGFYQRCQLVIRENNLKDATLWLVADDRFNQAALSFAKEHRVRLSNHSQLDMLYRILVTRGLFAGEETQPKDFVAYEMAIPMVPDAELVAVRALEQIAENVSFDDKAKGQIRMALIEACINAREAYPNVAAMVHLTFQTASDRLVTRIRVESASTGLERSIAEDAKNWSLKLLRNLMDEVETHRTHRGFELVMTKYMRNAKREAV